MGQRHLQWHLGGRGWQYEIQPRPESKPKTHSFARDPIYVKTHTFGHDPKHIKMMVIEDLKSETIDGKVKMYVNPDSTITSDDSKSYTNFKSLVKEHIHQVIEPDQVGKVLPCVHIAISNAKRLLLDVYHDITTSYLQNYLNEFCYKFNRRYFGDALFDQLMVAALTYKNDFRYNIA